MKKISLFLIIFIFLANSYLHSIILINEDEDNTSVNITFSGFELDDGNQKALTVTVPGGKKIETNSKQANAELKGTMKTGPVLISLQNSNQIVNLKNKMTVDEFNDKDNIIIIDKTGKMITKYS